MIHLSNYDPQWPKLYLAEKNRLSAIKRSELIVAIEHVGSTAIPGLTAKPIIDILVGVTDIQLLDDMFVSEICEQGYFYKSEYEKLMPLRKYFKRKIENFGFNLHVVTFQSDFFNRLINFRNILLTNETVLKEYQLLKYKLSAIHDDELAYANAKSSFIDKVLTR